jgi:BASS family bile acid:Na+ symporter
MKTITSALRLLGDRNFLFISAIVLGIAAGSLARSTQPLMLPALGLAMTVSLTQVTSDALRPSRQQVRPMVLSVILNYLVQGAVTLISARLLVTEPDLWVGFVLSAAAPPGAAVIPFSHILGGDTAFALIGTVGAYLAALVLTPAITLLLLGVSVAEPAGFVTILLQLIVVPLALSRLLLRPRIAQWLSRWRGKIVNWCFLLVVYTIIGLNSDVFLSEPRVVILVSIVTLARTFGLGLVLEKAMRRAGVERAPRMSYVLMSTLKNGAFAAGTALAMFGERSSVPAGVGAAIAVPYLLWVGMRWGKE